jgi:acyl-CoA thioesterase FadM
MLAIIFVFQALHPRVVVSRVGTLAARGKMVHVFVNSESGRPTDIPASLRTALETELLGIVPKL